MQAVSQNIAEWESVEVERSCVEARLRGSEDLRIRQEIIDRYANPPADTPFALEYAYHLLGDVGGKTVLDYGCGTGDNSVLVAGRGANVIGVDLSPELIDLAEARLRLHEIGERAEFRVGSAHDLPVEDGSVDVVFGIAILHHLDLKLASAEAYRVLKPSGRAIFLEPVRNSRLVWFVRNLIPYKAPDVSPYERPLTDAELAEFAAKFSGYETRAFSLPFVNLIEVLGLSSKVLNQAIKFDGVILKKMPLLKNYASVRVVEMTK